MGKSKAGTPRPACAPEGLGGLKELNTGCRWGCKTNSQGNITTWKGYKLHLDVTDQGIPVTAVITGANVHDSQVAIALG